MKTFSKLMLVFTFAVAVLIGTQGSDEVDVRGENAPSMNQMATGPNNGTQGSDEVDV